MIKIISLLVFLIDDCTSLLRYWPAIGTNYYRNGQLVRLIWGAAVDRTDSNEAQIKGEQKKMNKIVSRRANRELMERTEGKQNA